MNGSCCGMEREQGTKARGRKGSTKACMIRKYVLDAKGEPLRCDDIYEWGKSYESRHRIVKQEKVGDALVSTVFLGLDHNYHPDGPPILWETMVFRDGSGDEMDRCSGGIEQAEAMHQRMVQQLQRERRQRIWTRIKTWIRCSKIWSSK